MQSNQMPALPWSWEQKVADFQKPGDKVLFLQPFTAQALAELPEAEYDLVLNHGAACSPEDFRAIHRALKPDGFFLSQQPGGEDCRRLANFLLPGSRPATQENLETFTPALQAAGFRVMYKDQAYPVEVFRSVREVEVFVRTHPEAFPGVTDAVFASRREALEALLQQNGAIPNERHVFLLIGKKR